MTSMMIIAAVLIGAALAIGVYGGQAWLRQRWDNDVAWVRRIGQRFSPDPPDPVPFVALMYSAFVLAFVLLIFALPLIVAVPLWLLLLLVPRQVVNTLWWRRKRAIDLQIAPAVLQLSNSVSAGMTLVQSIEHLSRRAPEPIRTEFRIMANQWKHGADLGSTVRNAREQLQLANFDLFASTMMINQEMGGNLAETLDSLAGSLEALDHMAHEIYSATSEGRMNIKVLSVAPLAIVGLLFLLDFEATMMLFTMPLGRAILVGCALLTAIGTYIARRIINADI